MISTSNCVSGFARQSISIMRLVWLPGDWMTEGACLCKIMVACNLQNNAVALIGSFHIRSSLPNSSWGWAAEGAHVTRWVRGRRSTHCHLVVIGRHLILRSTQYLFVSRWGSTFLRGDPRCSELFLGRPHWQGSGFDAALRGTYHNICLLNCYSPGGGSEVLEGLLCTIHSMSKAGLWKLIRRERLVAGHRAGLSYLVYGVLIYLCININSLLCKTMDLEQMCPCISNQEETQWVLLFVGMSLLHKPWCKNP